MLQAGTRADGGMSPIAERSYRLRDGPDTEKITGVSLKMSPALYSVGGVPIPENHVPSLCEGPAAGTCLQPAPGLRQDSPGHRFGTTQPATARLDGGRRWASFRLFERIWYTPSGPTAAVGRKRPA